MKKLKKLEKLEDMPLWKEANAIAEYMYGTLSHFPEEERWQTRAKLHNATADFIFWAGLTLSNAGPTGEEFDWASFRKEAGAVKTMYRFACRQKFVVIDPEIMVRLDKLREQIDVELARAYAYSEEYRQEEAERDLRPWRAKYDIWLQLNKDSK